MGAGAVLNAPPVIVVNIVGLGVGVGIVPVGVGDGMGVALSRACTVAWTLAEMVPAMSDSATVALAVWVSATTACTVASMAGGSGV